MKKVFTLSIPLFIFLSSVFSQDVLYLSGSGATNNLTIQSGANVYCEGGYNAVAGSSGMEVDGNLYIGQTTGAYTSNWTDNMATTSVLGTSTGTVIFQSNNQQSITGTNTKFYKITFNNSSANTNGIRLLSNLTALNTATFQDGLVYANTYTFYINTSTAGAVTYGGSNTSTYSNSWVYATYGSGRFDRDIVSSGSTFDFPVGSSSAAQLLQVIPTSIGTITRFASSWQTGVTGATPLTLTECGTDYDQISNGGEWHLRPANGNVLGSGSFTGGNITLKGWNLAASSFPGLIDNQFAILERAEGSTAVGAWVVPSPSCSSLAAAGGVGRTVAGNVAIRNNLTDFSDNVSQLGIGITLIVLPIELTHFIAWNENDVNQLAWITSSEYNSDHFDVEKSANGIDFEKIGEVTAVGFSNDESNYTFTDLKPNAINYYRLRLVDIDNSFTYSNVVLIELGTDGAVSTLISPNPTADNINIQLESANDDNVIVQLTDAIGRVIETQNWKITSGNNFTSFDLSNFPSAIYFVYIHRENSTSRQCFKVVKQN